MKLNLPPSRSFRLGLLGLLLLLGLWFESGYYRSHFDLRWSWPAYRGFALWTDSDVSGWVGRPYSGLFDPAVHTGLRTDFRKRDDHDQRFEGRISGPWKFEVEGMDRARLSFRFRWWFLICLYVVAWLTMMGGLWWYRRKQGP